MSVKDVCKKYNLNIKEVEKDVYEVVDQPEYTNVSKFKREFDHCILIVSPTIKKEKIDGVCNKYRKVYYIILDMKDENKWVKFSNVVKMDFGESVICDYDKSRTEESLGTLYSIGR